MQTDLHWKMNLDTPPELVAIGIASENLRGIREYRLPELWSLHLYEYDVRIQLPDHGWLDVHPGCVTVVPAGILHRYHYRGPSHHVFTHYRLPVGTKAHRLSAVTDMGRDFPDLKRRALDAVKTFPVSPRRAEAFLWDTLWTLAERGKPHRDHSEWLMNHPALAGAREFIDLHLSDPLVVADIVAATSLSQSQLLRLFRAATGDSIIGYLRRRRAQSARHLLLNTTLPIKAVAVDVGLPDLQQFNKLIRHFWGKSPRALRRDAQRKAAL